MRPIDADALKASVPNTSADIFENCRNCKLLDDWQVKELIDNAPTVEPASQWHRVEEPPDMDAYVLAFDGDVVVMASFDGEKWWQHATYESFTISPSYWMPIELPKEEE